MLSQDAEDAKRFFVATIAASAGTNSCLQENFLCAIPFSLLPLLPWR
jgi:hypothetical protein